MILGKYFECLRQLEENNIPYDEHVVYQDGYLDNDDFRPPDDRMITLTSATREPYWDLEFYDENIIICVIKDHIPYAEDVTCLPAGVIVKRIVDFVAKAPKTESCGGPYIVKKTHQIEQTMWEKINRFLWKLTI